jgi:hypothetical protein
MGQNVAVIGHSSIDVSGAAGGGDIRIGKDARELNGPEAGVTFIGRDVALQARATQSGHGGMIETSAHTLNVQSTKISTLAVNGETGQWLLDPWNVTISSSPTSDGSFSGGVFTPTATSNINVGDLVAQLSSTHVNVTTGSTGTENGDITLANDLTYSGTNSLTLTAAGAIIMNASANLGGTLTLNAGGDVALGNINASALSVTGDNVTQNATISTSGGAVTINARGNFEQSAEGSIIAGSDSNWGNVTIHAGQESGDWAGAFTSSGTIEGNVIFVDTGAGQGGDMTQSGIWIAHDTNPSLAGLSILNHGTGHIIQTSTGSMTLAVDDINDIGIALTADSGNVTQAGTIDAGHSLVTLRAQHGDLITQDDGAGNVGRITSGATTIFGRDGASANLSGANSLGVLTGDSLGDLTVNDVSESGLILDTISMTGNLSVSAHSLSQPEETSDYGIIMSGTGKTADFRVAEGADVDLSYSGDYGNNFGGNAVSIAGQDDTAAGAVTVYDANSDAGLNLGAIYSNLLNIQANGSITQNFGTGLNVVSVTTLAAGSGNDITLTNAGNNFNSIGVASGRNVSLTDSNALNLASSTVSGSLNVNTGGDLTQSETLAVTGATTLNANSGNSDISLAENNTFSGGIVSVVGKDVNINQNGNLTISGVEAKGNVTIKANGGTLTLPDELSIILDNDLTNATVVLAGDELNNEGGSNSISLGAGAGNQWNIYLTHLDGNTFGDLVSNNQAVWGGAVTTPISMTGNRYIFGASQTLALAPLDPIPASMNLTKSTGGVVTLPTPTAVGSSPNYGMTGFVDAADYGNVFTQDTVNNVSITGLNYFSEGEGKAASVGSYAITMIGDGVSNTGYGISYDPSSAFGTLAVTEPTASQSSFDAPVNNPAVVQQNIQNALPSFSKSGGLAAPLNQQKINQASQGINPNFNTGESNQ